VIPRDALRYDKGVTVVRVQRGGSFEDRRVTIAAVNAHEAMVASGLDEGAVIARAGLAAGGRLQ
jgi:hypothetical protein